MEKIKNNLNKIILFLSLIAIGLVIPDIFRLLPNELNNYTVVTIISLSSIIAVNIILACKYKKDLASISLLIPMIIYIVSKIISNTYGILQNQFVSIAYLSMYVGIIVLYIIQIKNKNKSILFALYTLLALAISFTLLNVFTGSASGLSNLITLVLFTIIIYLNNKEISNNEKNNISSINN